MVIVDGYYHHVASVRHKEILALLARDVVVVGCSSMGALRAVELQPFGMIGNGTVFRMFRDGVLDADDEVALAHGEAPDYRRFGEPLVNIRYAVAAAVDAGVMAGGDAAAIISAAAEMHYTARGWHSLERALRTSSPQLLPSLRRLLDHLAAHPEHADVKAADAVDTLRRLNEMAHGGGDPAKEWLSSPGWRNHYLREWQSGFAGARVAGTHVSNDLLIRYQQIYHGEFPARWRRFVLGKICAPDRPERTAGAPTGEDLVGDALSAAKRQGVSADTLTDEQISTWLTARERSATDAEGLLVLVLVRSYRTARKVHDLVHDQPELTTDPAAQSAVAEAVAVNAEVASWRPGQSISHLKEGALREHLADVWQVGADDGEGLTAAARDRGFGSLPEAVEAARAFYLRSVFRSLDPAQPPVEGLAIRG